MKHKEKYSEKSENDKNVKIVLRIIIGAFAVAIAVIAIIFLSKSLSNDKTNSIDFNETQLSEIDNPEISIVLYPWDTGDKIPSEYTWEEYEALTEEEKTAFRETFLTESDFEAWETVSKAISEDEIVLYPWDLDGKIPSEYTWEEYEALTEEEKTAFKETFLTEDDFEVWKTVAQSEK